MKRKIILWCAEYLVFVEAGIVVVFILQKPTVQERFIQITTIGIITVLTWYLGALLKFLFKKERPSAEKMSQLRDRYSFPSMHTITVISASTYILLQNIYFGIVMYFVALLLMYSRVRTNMHYWIDMMGGASIGIVFTLVIHEYCKNLVTIFLNTYLW